MKVVSVKVVKLIYFDAYLSQTLQCGVESFKKFSEKAQTANFIDLTRQRQELCAENANKNTKTSETKTQITQKCGRF